MFTAEELYEINDCVDDLISQCKTALNQHDDEKETSSYRNVERRQAYLEALRAKIQGMYDYKNHSADRQPWRKDD